MSKRPDAPLLDKTMTAALISEQLQVIVKSQFAGLPLNCILAICLVFILRTDMDSRLLVGWLTTILAVNATRLIIAIRHRRRLSDSELTSRILMLHGFTAFLCGLVWAVVPSFMFRLHDASAPFLIFILCGITAGASVISGSYAICGIAFVCPILMSMTLKLTIMGDGSAYLMPLISAMYMALLVISVRRSEATFVSVVLLKLRATSLAASLDREHSLAKASAERLHRMANQDSLTGLANRAAFSSRLMETLDVARAEQSQFGLLLLDLDHFKSVNDTLGHSAGDEVLKETARRLTSILDSDQIVARLGGDEFAVLHLSPADLAGGQSAVENAERLACRILDAVSGTFDIGDHPVSIGLSVGLAMFPADGATTESLLANADLALYAAKGRGRQCWRRFDAALLAEATMARDVERDLQPALAGQSVQVFYQPQIALRDGRVTGLEALLRWHHPVHGWVSPPAIVAAARRIRASRVLTEFILADALQLIRRLDDIGVPEVLVAVNVSPCELEDYDLPALVRLSLSRFYVEPRRLEVEITEEALVGSGKALGALEALSAMGVRLAIDDFGTGCSALAYLRSMRVDRIKIDRSFVTGLSDRVGDRILVQAIIGIGQSFGIEVVAEGVEALEEVELLRTFGCGVLQGYHFARALREDKLLVWLADRAGDETQFGATTQVASALPAPVVPRHEAAA